MRNTHRVHKREWVPRRMAGALVLAAALSTPLLLAKTARADRYYVVYEERPEPRSSLNLGFDLEGAIPTVTPHFLSGNDLTGGGGFKIRVGDQLRYPILRFIPEGGYAFNHLFAVDNLGNAYDWDMHRFFGGARLAFGRVVEPGFYAHAGYGWRDTGDPTVPHAGGLMLDAAFILDIHVIPDVGFGGHAEYVTLDAQPYAVQWLALGMHGDIAF
jgi:hypothetical protein